MQDAISFLFFLNIFQYSHSSVAKLIANNIQLHVFAVIWILVGWKIGMLLFGTTRPPPISKLG